MSTASSSGETLELSYTSPIMMLHQVLEPAEKKAVTVSATGSLDMSTGIPLPQVTEEHSTWEQLPGRQRLSSLLRSTPLSSIPPPTFWLDSTSAAFDCVICAP